MEVNPADESLLVTSIAFIAGAFHIRVPLEGLVLAFLDKVLAAMKSHHGTCKVALFLSFCDVVYICCWNGLDMPLHAYASVVRSLWHGIAKHKDDENAQDKGRKLLRTLVSPVEAQKMIHNAVMHQAEDDDCAVCA